MDFPDKNAAAIRVIENSKILEQIGFEVIFIGIDRDIQYKSLNKIIKADSVLGFKTYKKPYPKSIIQMLYYYTSGKWISKIKRIVEISKVYAIIAYNFPAIPLYKLKKYTDKNNMHLIADCTEWYGSTKNPIVVLDTFLRMRFVHKKIKNIICVSNFIEEYYKNKKCNTVNIPTLSPILKFIKPELKNKYFTFSYVGDPGKGKKKDRLDYLIRALFILKKAKYKFKLNIVGIDKSNLITIYADLKNMIHLMSEDIVFCGRLPRNESLIILLKSDFSIFFRKPSRLTMAGFPTKLGESFSLGIPVITNSFSNISDFLVNKYNGYIINDCSVDSIVKVLIKAINTEKVSLEKMKQNLIDSNPLAPSLFIDSFDKFIKSLV